MFSCLLPVHGASLHSAKQFLNWPASASSVYLILRSTELIQNSIFVNIFIGVLRSINDTTWFVGPMFDRWWTGIGHGDQLPQDLCRSGDDLCCHMNLCLSRSHFLWSDHFLTEGQVAIQYGLLLLQHRFELLQTVWNFHNTILELLCNIFKLLTL